MFFFYFGNQTDVDWTYYFSHIQKYEIATANVKYQECIHEFGVNKDGRQGGCSEEVHKYPKTNKNLLVKKLYSFQGKIQ